MESDKKESEILQFATEILSWKLPFSMTSEKLYKIRVVAGSVITKTHDHLINQFNLPAAKSMKPNISIKDLVEYNKSRKAAQ